MSSCVLHWYGGRGKNKKKVDFSPGSSECSLAIVMSSTMPINVIMEPFMARGAAQRQGDILAEKAPCFYGSAAIVCVGYLVVQRATVFWAWKWGGCYTCAFENQGCTHHLHKCVTNEFKTLRSIFQGNLPYIANYSAFCPFAWCKCKGTASWFVGISRI